MILNRVRSLSSAGACGVRAGLLGPAAGGLFWLSSWPACVLS